MSGMNFLEKLLDGVTAEWKTLGEIGEFTYGYAAKAQDSGDARFVRITDIDINGKLIATDSKYVDISGENERYLLKKDDLLMARTGATYGKTMIFEEDYPAIYAGFLIKLSFDERVIIPKFYWHFAQSNFFWNQANRLVSGGGQPQFNANVLKDVKILIPLLETQAEIVRILDTFTALTAELTAELSDRKKQYEYYRDRLLSFEEGEVEWKTLGKIGKILRGTAITEKESNPGEYPVVANGPSHNYFHDKSNRSGETVVIARSGVYAGLVSYWDISIFLTDAFSIHPDNDVLSTKFLYYVLKKDQTKIHNMSKGAGVPHVRAKDFESYKVPVPSLEEQAHIVAILDKFDTLTHSISEGLPREIALRQKQYEYYRDLLLTFPKTKEGK
jgi:type I restriction enzyme, S subunit